MDYLLLRCHALLPHPAPSFSSVCRECTKVDKEEDEEGGFGSLSSFCQLVQLFSKKKNWSDIFS
jgi:hypothetical protein